QAVQGARAGERATEEGRGRAGTRSGHAPRGCQGKLLSPARRRAAVRHLQQRFGVSERRACRVVGQPRSSQRYEPEQPARDRALVDEMEKLARKHPRYGYRRIWACLRREGWRVNRKRVQRLWREHGFKVVRHQSKRRRLGSSENGAERLRAERRNHVWSYDFTMDQTADGRRLKFLAVVDEHTRE